MDISDEDLDRCAKEIDTDGNGTISFDEFAIWFIGGKEGSPDLGDKLSGYLNISSKYSNDAITVLDEQLKKLEEQGAVHIKDIRTSSIKIKASNCTARNAGI